MHVHQKSVGNWFFDFFTIFGHFWSQKLQKKINFLGFLQPKMAKNHEKIKNLFPTYFFKLLLSSTWPKMVILGQEFEKLFNFSGENLVRFSPKILWFWNFSVQYLHRKSIFSNLLSFGRGNLCTRLPFWKICDKESLQKHAYFQIQRYMTLKNCFPYFVQIPDN